MKSICVYCGSNAGSKPIYANRAAALGDRIAKEGLRLVYGGGNVGLMGIVADAVLSAGGEVTGVIPQQLVDWEVAHRGVTSLEVVGSMHERKSRMFELSDAFVALPGGFGTMEEIFEMLTWRQLGIGNKPCAFLDHAVDHADQGRVEAVDVEEGAGLVADAELAPGQHLEHLVQGAEAAGQGDEAVGQVEHAHLALVHRADDLQLGQAAVRDLPVGQLLRDHAGDLAAGLEHGVGDDAHQADVAAAVDQADAFAGQAVAQGDGAFGVGRLAAGVGAAIDADRAHGSGSLGRGLQSLPGRRR